MRSGYLVSSIGKKFTKNQRKGYKGMKNKGVNRYSRGSSRDWRESNPRIKAFPMTQRSEYRLSITRGVYDLLEEITD
jgi:hypothetical protein